MKIKFTLFSLAFFFIILPGRSQQIAASPQALPGNIQKDWYSRATAYAEQLEYDFYPAADHFRTSNSANGIGFLIGKKGYTVYALQDGNHKTDWEVNMLLHSIGRNNPVHRFSENSIISKSGKDLVHRFEFAEVQYDNNKKGLRQNFIVNEKPGGKGMLRVQLEINSTLSRKLVNSNSLVFYSGEGEKNTRLVYEDLKVWDASHTVLNAHMELNDKGDRLSIVVDDKDAVYPVTIDPLNDTPDWSTSADGIIPGLLNTLQLRVNSLYGFNVTNLGDINNDTYDDVAVGAPGMANVITGSGSLLGVGAVFIYLGSDTGLADVPDKVLQPSSASAGALFGFSVDAGNISADGAGYNDLVIGAPMDTYQITVTGLLGIQVNVDVTAGTVYYYMSENLASLSNPAPAVRIRLEGDGFFGIGVLGLLDNTGVNALFGYSVAVTEDMNGDSRQDVIIGCPAYLGKNLLSVKSGAAFVYYSNGLSTATPVQLNTPTPSILGLITLPLANLNGLLFGYSVEGTGDYNNDGFPDIAVGAPAGINLNSLGGIFTGQVLGGSVYIYYGNGSGVNNTIGASLHAAPSGLLSNAANLFGYKIKAVKNAAGARNGNILVSATTGSVLSNIVGGLRLKAGQVHVFRKKTSAFSSPVISDQALSSPRATPLLGLLTGQDLNVSLLYGASIDNMRDVNCDGVADIIIGEPLSTNVPVIGANITGGAAYAYLGLSNGTYKTTPDWSLLTQVSSLLGVNATSLIGFSVAGGVRTNGPAQYSRAIVGGPTNTLDFGAGLLNLGNTLGTLYSFAFDNNGIGKAYNFEMNLCMITLPVKLTDFSGRLAGKTVQLKWVSEQELNVNMYELQRSADGRNFETVALVFAQNGQHNEYAYPDAHPYTGINYYRLKIVDTDRRIEYSKVISFVLSESTGGSVFVTPNPVREQIRARLSNFIPGIYSMHLYSTDGQLKMAKKISITQQEQIETIKRESTMLPGIYWLHLYNKEGKMVRTVNIVIGD